MALLRSLAVAPEARGSGLGQALVRFAEREAAARHIGRLYLLTNTAAPFFAKLGYQATARETAPPAIRRSAQFSGLCPASASFLSKRLDD
ncbi:acetyltransferase [compost metagenome]